MLSFAIVRHVVLSDIMLIVFTVKFRSNNTKAMTKGIKVNFAVTYIIPTVLMLSVITQTDTMFNAVTASVIMLNVVAPLQGKSYLQVFNFNLAFFAFCWASSYA